MITYRAVRGAPGFGWFVVVVESGVIVSGPWTTQEQAQSDASKRGTS